MERTSTGMTRPAEVYAEPTAEELRRKRILERSRVFRALDAATMRYVVSASSLFEAKRRTALPSDLRYVYVLGAGRIRVVRRASDGRELTMDYRYPGELTGEEALIHAPENQLNLASERIEAVQLRVDTIKRLFSDHSGFALAFMEFIGERLRSSQRRMETLLTRSVESRVVEFILDSAERHGEPDSRGTLVGIKFTHQEIASFVGSTRETVTLILGELRKNGWVAFDHRRILVTDATSMRARL
ncbi:MAG: Crp/Fnr family transcriptional regulator [Myxococcota bacterium]